MVGALVGIVAYRLRPGRVSGWDNGAFAVPDSYVHALDRAGVPSALVCAPGPGAAEELLRPFSGLMLIGGGDVEPGRYGAEPDPRVYGIDPDRDSLEIELLRAANRLGIPALGICRGAQVLNVAFGGTLIQHLPDEAGRVGHGMRGEDATLHSVKVSPGSRLRKACRGEELACSSHHHQGIDRLGEGLVPVAWSEDGMVEGIETAGGWMLGVQWHPEDTARADPAQQSLFDAFADRARELAGGG